VILLAEHHEPALAAANAKHACSLFLHNIMNPILLLVGFSNIMIGTLTIACAIPLVRHKVKMNEVYGIRIRKSFSSPENWEKINEYGGRALIYWSIPIIAIGIAVLVAAFFIPKFEPKDVCWIIAPTFLSVAMLMGGTIQILMWSKKLPD
jgi:hypothetical protein